MTDPVWHDDDSLWEYIQPMLFDQSLRDEIPTQIDQIIELLGISPGARILDLCCGPGRHSLEFARRGYVVTGVDRTARYLDLARKQATKDKLEIEFIEEDMRTFRQENAFDGAVNLFTSFGYFDDQQEDMKVLKNLYNSLKPSASLVMEMVSKEILARIFQARDWSEREDGTLFLQERKVARDWSWMENRWIFIRGDQRREFQVNFRLYSGHELADALTRTGFSEVNIYGNLDASPYDNKAKRLVAVAKK